MGRKLNYEMYKEEKAEDILLHWQSMVFRNRQCYLPGPIFHTKYITNPWGRPLLLKKFSVPNCNLGSCVGYNGGVSPDAFSYSRLQ